jgi:hypothetical protein
MEQGTPEWFAARLGIPTASMFGKIVTATGKLSTQANAYMYTLLAEKLTGSPVETFRGNWATERGHTLEPMARDYYGLVTGNDVEQVGFCTNEQGTIGFSPDGLVGDDGLLEIKCGEPHTHVAYLLEDKVPTKYVPQVQGALWVSQREWIDTLCFHPDMPPVLVRSEPDLEYHQTLADAMSAFMVKMEKSWAKLKGRV